MGVRDILLFAVVFGGIPFMVFHPYIGVLYWVWLGMMNPHRLAFGTAYDYPFSYAVALATLLGLVLTRDEVRLKGGKEVLVLALFMVWLTITTLFAFHPESAQEMWEKVAKIQLMALVGLWVLASRRHIELLVWVLVVSLGYYGVKGGLFTLRGGGEHRVWGPGGSFIADNNALALALIMTIPLMHYLFHVSKLRWMKWLLAGSMVLMAASALGAHSRGALLAIAAMAIFLWLKMPRKILSGVFIAVVGMGLISFMPDAWWDRMETIGDYQQDSSAVGRINAWHTAFNIAQDRLLGGGFALYEPDVFAKYAPIPEDLHAAHSIYFQVLGEHGFIGLVLFLIIWWQAWRCAQWIRTNAKGQEQWVWAGYLATMIQVSLIGYAVGGAFLSLAYWDLPYYELVILIVMRDLIRRGAGQEARRRPWKAVRAPIAIPRSHSEHSPKRQGPMSISSVLALRSRPG